MKNLNLLFIHGGPGLNTNPEKIILTEDLLKNSITPFFWNEPSSLRPNEYKFTPDNAYSNWKKSFLVSLEKFKEKPILVCSSFGALAALHLMEKISDKVQKIVFISPTIFLNDVFKIMINFSIEDYKSINDERHVELSSDLQNSTSFYDGNMRKALGLVYQNPKLFLHYWVSMTKMGLWASHLSEPNFLIDSNSQDSVLMDLKNSEENINNHKYDIRLDVIVGKHDPVYLAVKNESLLKTVFSNITFHSFSNSAHFPHIEETQRFIEVIKL